MKVVILGTGATSGTLRTGGGVDGFVGRLEVVKPNWRGEYSDLARVIDDCGENPAEIGLDRVWTRIDYYSKFNLILGSEYGGAAAIQLHKAVTDAYSFSNDIDRVCRTPTDFTLRSILYGLEPGDALISFNWDTLAESILQHLLGRDVVQAPHPSAFSHVRLIKPHGSLSWVHRSGEPIVFSNGSKPILQTITSDQIYEQAGGFVQPFLLGAVPIKSELLKEVQRCQPGIYELVVDQWREAMDVLSRVTEIVVVGYRFPAEDVYGRFLFREAFLKRPKQIGLPAISYYALPKDREQFEKAFREVFSDKVKYEYMGKIEFVD